MKTRICTTIIQLQEALSEDRLSGKSIGFVPTMGALHEGHLSLVDRANAENDVVVCSIFVNPTQFNDPKDLEKYPRTLDADLRLLDTVSCTYTFVPSVNEMYPHNQQLLDLDFGKLETTMEGEFRPGHFKGMATIVDRLFRIVNPDTAYFGEKDFQQLAVIRKMVLLLHHRIHITGCPTLREHDGLAMSSRNSLLDEGQRKAAPLIYQALSKANEFIPHHSVSAIKNLVIRYIEQSPLLKVQYFNIVDPQSLEDINDWNGHTSVQGCIAVLTSGPRLIDNINYRISQ